MKKVFTILASLALVLFMNSCASLTGFEEGRTLGEGNSEFGVSLNYTSVPDIFGDDLEAADIDFPNVELNYKYGVMEKLDVGARVSTNLSSGAYAKYQLVGDRQSQFALSPGIELSSILGLAYTVHVPIYTSIHPKDNISINLNPRFVYQFPSGDATEGINYIGGNAGILFGRKHKFGIDIGYYSVDLVDADRSNLLTFGIGGKFRFGDNFSSGSSRSMDDDSDSNTRKRKRRKRR